MIKALSAVLMSVLLIVFLSGCGQSEQPAKPQPPAKAEAPKAEPAKPAPPAASQAAPEKPEHPKADPTKPEHPKTEHQK